jgi:hypothetical protein
VGAPGLAFETGDTTNLDQLNGDVHTMTDSVMGTWSYTNDEFNRLTFGRVFTGGSS